MNFSHEKGYWVDKEIIKVNAKTEREAVRKAVRKSKVSEYWDEIWVKKGNGKFKIFTRWEYKRGGGIRVR